MSVRGVLMGLVLGAMGCAGGEETYRVHTVYQDDCDTGLRHGAALALVTAPDAASVTFEVPELGLSLPCTDYDDRTQVCARETEDGARERWFWGLEEGVLVAAMDRTAADGAFCMSTMTARPWGTIDVEVTDRDLEQAALIAAFLAAPPEVQLGAAAAVAWFLTQLDLSIIADGSS